MDIHRRKFAILIIAVTVLTFGWITVGTSTEEVPFVSIEQLVNPDKEWKQDRFRLGGYVEIGSIEYSADHLTVTFVMDQDDSKLNVKYKGLPPDMFTDEAEVIIEGTYADGVFMADNLMTKCASRYETEIEVDEAHIGEVN